MKMSYAGCSQRGLVRSTNEDAYLMRSSGHAALFLVADGIGGRAHGGVVSAMLRDGYDAWFRRHILLPGENLDFQAAVGGLRGVLLEQNKEVIRRFGPGTAGSTIVLLFILGNRYLYFWSGDSRIYRGHRLSVKQITIDDVYENWTDRPAKWEPSKVGKLVGAVGICPVPKITLGTGALCRGDRFFLCSDGVYRYLSDRDLRMRLRFSPKDPGHLIADLAGRVEGHGAGDNYSMIFARVDSV